MAHKSSQEARIATTVAIDRDKNSQHAVKWALDNLPTGIRQIVLVHVYNKMQPQDAFSEKIMEDAKLQNHNELQQFFLPYRGICARKGVRAKEIVLIDLDIASALAEYISENNISAIVLGAANRIALFRAFKNLDIPSSLAKCVPDFCTIYAVSRGKAQILKLATRTPVPVCHKPATLESILPNAPCSEELSDQGHSWCTENSESTDRSSARVSLEMRSVQSGSFRSSNNSSVQDPVNSRNNVMQKTSSWKKTSSPDQFLSCASDSTQSITHHANDIMLSLQKKMKNPNIQFIDADSLSSCASEFCELSGPQVSISDVSYDQSDASSTLSDQATGDVEEEIRRLRQEFNRTLVLYQDACKEENTTREKQEKVKQTQDTSLPLLQREAQKNDSAAEVALLSQRIAELESQKRRCAESKVHQVVKEKEKAMDALAYKGPIQNRKYSINDIEVATNNFALQQKIGEGSFGSVFKGFLDHTDVAIKVLKPEVVQVLKPQQIEVLSQTRHPNVVMLLGACPENGCLVYEYMTNGSLRDRLFRRNGSPPLPWRTRFKIAADVALALNFLHQARPSPIVHCDINPGNILLDRNFVSKISDGLSRLVPQSVADSITHKNITSAKDTFCYIDPQFLQTGMLTTKSDIYSFGILLLQLITARNPKGLSYYVETAIEKGAFRCVLDPTARDWPVDEALSFAKLALKCCQLKSSDRPDLGSVILPELERIRDIGL